jgi:ferredoxin
VGHMVGKDLYKRLGKKVDNLTIRAPWNDAFFDILKSLYSEKEAEVVIKMPYALSSLDRIQKTSKISRTDLERVLDQLCIKGLVIDLDVDGTRHFMPSPMIIGIFEFTMMRTGDNLDSKGWAKHFHDYMSEGSMYKSNFDKGQQISLMRTVPHDDSVRPSSYAEILDYERAASIVRSNDTFSLGLCSCRHEKSHVNEKHCDMPMDNCAAFGYAADYLIRNNLAKEVSKEQMMDNLDRSRDLGLVLNADNVQNNVTFMCHCCGCCCNVLRGLNIHGYANVVVTSSFIADVEYNECIGCGKCAKACPISAIEMQVVEGAGENLPKQQKKKKKQKPVIDKDICIGCGVCSLSCKPFALSLIKREQRVIHPETTFKRVVLLTLERGTLQNQILDNPNSSSQAFMRGLIGAFLKLPPIKKTLMSDMFRSTFLKSMETGIKLQGKEWMTKL